MLTPPPPLLLLPWKISYCEFGWIESGETLVLMHDCTWNIQDSLSYFWNSAQSLFPFANFFHLRFKMYFHWNFILFFTHFIVFLLNIIWSNIAHVTCLQELEMFRWPELLTTQVPKPAIFLPTSCFEVFVSGRTTVWGVLAYTVRKWLSSSQSSFGNLNIQN